MNLKKLGYLIVVAALLVGCKKNDWREPFTGTFDFMCRQSTMTMCTDTTAPEYHNGGWMEINVDTTHFKSDVVALDTDKVKIQFGEGNIGPHPDIQNTSLSKTVCPIIDKTGELSFPSPDYPSGGHNKYTGKYVGTDTIKIDITYGVLIGSYRKYQIVGTRTH